MRDKVNLMLVEDEVLIAMMESMELGKAGYDVVHVQSGEAAIAAMDRGDRPVDLILMDIDLGKGLDGTETAREILGRHDLPVVFLSSHTERELVGKTEEITSYGYVVKNSGVTVLDASIKMALKLFDARRTVLQRDRDLEEANLRFDQLTRQSGTFIWEVDAGGLYTYVSPAVRDILGYEPAEIVGRLRIHDRHPEAGSAEFRDAVLGVFERRGPFTNLSNPATAKDGRTVWLSTNGIPLLGGDGQLVGYRGADTDITGRRLLERKLLESEERMRIMFEHAPLGIAMSDSVSGSFIEVNRRYAEIVGRTREELETIDWASITHPDDLEEDRRGMARLNAGEIPGFAMRKRFLRPDGTEVWVDMTIAGLGEVEGGRPLHLSIIDDVTARKQGAEAARYEQYLASVLMDTIPDHIYYKDRESRFLRVNRSHALKMGFSDPSEAIGKTDFDIFAPEEARKAFKDEQTVIATGQPIVGIEEIETWPDGSRTWASTTKVPLRNASGEVIGTFGLSRDITGRRAAEDLVQRMLAEKETFLREAHHRVKNNMNGMYSLLSWEAMAVADEEEGGGAGPRASEILADAANRVRGLSILYDRLYRATDQVDQSLRDYLPPLLGEIARILPGRAKVEISTEVEDIVLGETILSPLGIIMYELMTNSVKHAFAEGTTGRVAVSARRSAEGIVVIYGDDGAGMPDAATPAGSGSFGMQLIESLVGQLGGTLRIERGAGTRFVIELPARPERARA